MPSPTLIQRLTSGRQFSPLSIPGFAGWYKADSLSLANNAAITQWNDSSPFARHLTQGTVANQPLFKTNQVNGFPGILFDGSNDFFSLPSLTLATDFTVLCVNTSAISTGEILGNTVTNRQFRVNRSGTNCSFFAGGSEIIMSGGTTTQTARKLLGWRRTGSTVSFRENATNRTGGSDSNSTTVNEVGNTSFSDPYNGTIFEIVIYSRFLTDAENDQLYNKYFKPKWSLP